MQRVADEKEYFGVRWLDSAFIRYGSTYLRFGLIRCGMSKKSGVEPPQSKLVFAKLRIFLVNRLRLRLTRMRCAGAELRLRKYFFILQSPIVLLPEGKSSGKACQGRKCVIVSSTFSDWCRRR